MSDNKIYLWTSTSSTRETTEQTRPWQSLTDSTRDLTHAELQRTTEWTTNHKQTLKRQSWVTGPPKRKSYISLSTSSPLMLSFVQNLSNRFSIQCAEIKGFRASCIRCWVGELTILPNYWDWTWLVEILKAKMTVIVLSNLAKISQKINFSNLSNEFIYLHWNAF